MVRWRTLLLTSLLLALGCDRPVSGKSTSIIIQAPGGFGKINSMALPSGRKACYAVNVTAPDIKGPPSDPCSPAFGVAAGYVEAGEPIKASVAKGSDRRIDLYVLLKNAGDNSSCPVLGTRFNSALLNQIYLVGSATKLNFVNDTEEVIITATFPGETNTIAAQLSLPASCIADGGAIGNPGKFRVSASQQVATGTGLILRARLGRAMDKQTSTGTGLNVNVK